MKTMTMKIVGNRVLESFKDSIEGVKSIPSEIKKMTWKKVKEELFEGWTLFEKFYISALLILQIVVFIIYPDSIMGMIAGITGVLCVTFVAKGKISNYYFGFVQTGITLVLGLQNNLRGEFLENAFYFVTQFKGYKEWKENKREDEDLVKTKKLSLRQWVLNILGVAVVTYVLGTIFSFTNGTQPYIDALTLAIAIFGQLLMVFRYRENWLYWGILNIVSIYQFYTLGNMSLVALFVAQLINVIYGYAQWNKLEKTKVVLETTK